MICGVLTLMVAYWVSTDPVSNLQTDWTSFDNASNRLFDGDEIYRPLDIETEPLPYLYPPFVLWLGVPLRLFGFYGSWVLSVAMTALTLLAGVRFLLKATPGATDPSTGAIVALTTGTFFGATLIGQYSGIYVMALGVAVWLWSNHRTFLAGLALAILVMKPNLGIAVPVVLVWSRSFRALAGFACGAGIALLSSLPFGLDKWPAFVANVQDMARLQQNEFLVEQKMVTIIGGVQSLFGWTSTSPISVAVWLATSALIGVATLSVWTRTKLAQNPVRAFAVFGVFVIIANPRMYFYDGALIVFGFLAIWLIRGSLGPLAQRWIPRLCAVGWFFSWGSTFQSLNAMVGPLAAVFVLLIAVDAYRIVDVVESRGDGEAQLDTRRIDGVEILDAA